MAGGAKKMSGKTDLLEAACAACVMVGNADGDFSDDEAMAALDRLTAHETLSAAFSTTQIETTFDRLSKLAKQGVSGRVKLKREVEEAVKKSSADELEMVYCIAIDVAAADGEVGAKEMKSLKDIGVIFGGLSPERYLA